MKQKTMYTETQPDVRYTRVSESRADVIVNKYIGEEEMIVDPEKGVKQIMYAYMTNIFSVDPNGHGNRCEVKSRFLPGLRRGKRKGFDRKSCSAGRSKHGTNRNNR